MLPIIKFDKFTSLIKWAFIFVLVLSIPSCGMQDMMKNTEKFHDIAMEKCNCEDVRLINYSKENFRTYAHIEIVGADEKNRLAIANKINAGLKDSISDYCDIEEFILDFINKGKHNVITIRYCKIEE